MVYFLLGNDYDLDEVELRFPVDDGETKIVLTLATATALQCALTEAIVHINEKGADTDLRRIADKKLGE